MTLYKKLVIGVITAFVLLTASISAFDLKVALREVKQQKQADLRDTVSTIGLTLAPYLKAKDKVAIESVLSSMFDGTSYSSVQLINYENDETIKRTFPPKPHNVPDWFTASGLFQPIEERTIITSGWENLAEIVVISDPNDAYAQIWQTLLRVVFVSGLALLVGIVIIMTMIRRTLAPIAVISQKAKDLTLNKFGQPLERPKSKDLISLVDCINRIAKQLEISFQEQLKEAQRLREQAYIDPVSKLGNRTMFIAQLDHWLSERTMGGVAILQISHVSELYNQRDYQAADNLITAISRELSTLITAPNVTIARNASDEIAFIFPHMDESELKLIANSIVDDKIWQRIAEHQPIQRSLLLGVTHTSMPKNRNDILAMVDTALAKAKARPNERYGFLSGVHVSHLLGKSQWKKLVEQAVAQNLVQFRFQQAKTMAGDLYHQEVFSYIKEDGKEYQASEYLFALEQLNSSELYDRHVINAMLNYIEQNEVKVPVAINLAVASVLQPSFVQWLTESLAARADCAAMLHFELPEESFLQHPHHTALLCHAITSYGAKYGIDNFGRNFNSLEYINNFHPSYVKLDYLYTHNLDEETHKYTLSSLSRTAHNLNITTIACRVESQSQLDFLSDGFIDVYQGFMLDKESLNV